MSEHKLSMVEIWVILIILALMAVFLLAGCTCLWTDDAFYMSCLKDVDFDRVAKEPNSLIIERYKGQTDEVKVYSPYGIIETK